MRRSRRVIFILFAFLASLVVVFWANSRILSRAEETARQAVDMSPVVIVTDDLERGRTLTAADLRVDSIDSRGVPAGAAVSADDVIGRVLATSLFKGDLLRNEHLLSEGAEAGVAGMLEERYRAVGVRVDAPIAVGGWVRPGSHVDVLATMEDADGKPFTVTVLQDVAVLAVDGRISETKSDKQTEPELVTLRVTTDQAESLVFAVHRGRLHLSMRHPLDSVTVTTSGADARSVRATGRAATPPSSSLRIDQINGNAKTTVYRNR